MISTIRSMTNTQKEAIFDVALFAACLAFIIGFAGGRLVNDSQPPSIAAQYAVMSAEERADFLTWATTDRVRAVIYTSALGLDAPVTRPRSDTHSQHD